MALVPDSILDTTKKLLMLDADYDVFDLDVMTHINSIFATLHQLGVGPKSGYVITSSSDLWTDFTSSANELVSVKSYVFAKVRLLFDPPTNAFLVTSLEKICSEYEQRLLMAAEDLQNEPNP